MDKFDAPINRVGTNSSKYDAMEKLYGVSPQNGLSMWTADMDFRSPKCVTETLKKLVDHGIFGYYGNQDSYNKAACQWYLKRHNWSIDPDWISVCHGLVAGIGIAIRAFSKPGEKVIIFTPVYHSFLTMIKKNNRQIVECPLKLVNGEYFIDFGKLAKLVSGEERILLFCSPHNPGGKIWSKKELNDVADFCRQQDLILVSDEIHNDLVYPGNNHLTFPIAVSNITDRLVMMVSSTKTFNIAGGLMGNVIIEDHNLRSKFKAAHQAIGTSPNLFGMKIAESAYLNGGQWLDELMLYLAENKKLFDAGIKKINGLQSMRLDATYLAWVDFSETGMNERQIVDRVHQKAGIVASIGSTFGKGGETFMRFNLACPRNTIYEAVRRLQQEFK